jgi:hypothetical protein
VSQSPAIGGIISSGPSAKRVLLLVSTTPEDCRACSHQGLGPLRSGKFPIHTETKKAHAVRYRPPSFLFPAGGLRALHPWSARTIPARRTRLRCAGEPAPTYLLQPCSLMCLLKASAAFALSLTALAAGIFRAKCCPNRAKQKSTVACLGPSGYSESRVRAALPTRAAMICSAGRLHHHFVP